MIGFLNINKPSGVTSNYVVSNVKRKLKIKKVGHFGTLDPLASGVLPIAIGKATKLFDYFLNKHKVYIATFCFGYETDTLDSQGKIIRETNNIPSLNAIEEKLNLFLGKQSQIPPKFSAKNVNGVRAYDLARKGEDFTLPSKEIEIFEIKLLKQIDDRTFEFYIHCSSGTYIRSIARDIANSLDSYATMIGLIRQKTGIFTLENAINIDDDYMNNILSIEQVLPDLEKVNLPTEYYKKMLNGMKFQYPISTEECLLYCNNELFGIATTEDNYIKLKVNLKETDV